jgi:1,4-alpha-glucan branching enzyme/maltooligosyltrehalose trehalohydrolase
MHSMPFGAELTPQGARFRLWAPACEAVALSLDESGRERLLPMAAAGDGWFELTTDAAEAGSRYRFAIGEGMRVPDPASRFNPGDVHQASEVIDPKAFDWQDRAWHGRPWHEAVIYELHVGAFAPEGSFAGVRKRLDYLAELGVTAIELMPVADFPGLRDWGYDGALPFAPDSSYGRPEDFKSLVQDAHKKGLMVLLDVVFNHFGPEGNYLHLYAPQFFTEHYHTPWGAALNFDGVGSAVVRDFFIHNALYWLEEYHLDGLRLDAVHAIFDRTAPHILTQLSERVRQRFDTERHVHLVLENDANEARYLSRDAAGMPRHYQAQWNDDSHHAMHVLATGETEGYYADYADAPIRHLGRCLAEGFAYQGEASVWRSQEPRGELSCQLPPQAFVAFVQSHDQVGNRAFGERINALAKPDAVRACAATVLLAPSIPLLFMGEEFAATVPFLFFSDFGLDLCAAVAEGRRREFCRLARFADPTLRATIPDPNAEQTFLRSKLDWEVLRNAEHAAQLAFYRELLAIRRRLLVPRLAGMDGAAGEVAVLPPSGLQVDWRLADGSMLHLLANFSDQTLTPAPAPRGQPVFATPEMALASAQHGMLEPWAVVWSFEAGKQDGDDELRSP